MYAGSPKHPIFSGSTFGLMSGEKPLFQPQVQGGHEALGGALQQMGLHFEETHGKYAEPERSYIIHNPTLEQMQQLGKMFGQESIVHSENGQHKLVYTNGEHEGKYHPAQTQTPLEHFEQPPNDFYTMTPGHGYFRINFDFNQKHPLNAASSPKPAEAQGVAKADREMTPDQAARLAKGAVAQLLASQAPRQAHPHAYDWHDGHTDNHQEDLAGPQLPGLRKDQPPMGHPHMDTPAAPAAPHPTNDQAAGVGVSTYKQYALPYGNVQPGSAPDLLHYKYHGKLPEIEKLVADHGYKTYYAGGKYGKPDLASKNYNTGHLMVYDPTPESGANFGHEEYTRGWRQIHELAHALTYPELNKTYGEGRRMGKLGIHRTTNEALRAVHWEWLAAHKQRELSKQIGVHLSDQDFHKELNTVMHDAVHRAVTGKFTEPSGEGYTPHAHKVPLHTALQMVRDAAHQMGLTGLHDTIKKASMQKNLPLKSPAAAGVTRAPAAAPALHNSVEGFMSGLKALPKGDPSRGKFITAHMNHPDFLNALGTHPQGKQIHAMLTQHLNSTANAGLGVGAKVTMKSEPNLSSAEGESSVADEKTYTVEEANAYLLKATREKVETFEKSIKALRERELKKALIPPHKHNQSVQAGPASEDIPPGKLNPKGVDKSKVEKNAVMGYGAPGNAPVPGPSMAMAEKKAEALCKKCGKGHGELEKCGDIVPGKDVAKADLVAENGKRTDNHTVDGSKLPPKKVKEVNKGSEKDPGSGGIKLPGSNLKKNAAPPMAKPPSGKNMGTAVPTSAPKAPAMKSDDLEKGYISPSIKHGISKPVSGPPPAPKPVSDADHEADKKAAGIKKAALPGQNVTALAGAPAKGTGGPDLIPSDPAPKPAAKPQFGAADLAAGKAKLAAQGISGPKLPGAGLKSPKAAGVTRGAMAAPAAPAVAAKPAAAPGPVMSAARPAAAKPGIFGKLFGKAEDRPEVVPQNSPEEKKFRADNAKATAAGKKGVPAKPGDGVAKADDKPEAPKAPDKATQTLFEDPMPKVLHPSDKKKGPKK